jgi:OMF family outer membrane factor
LPNFRTFLWIADRIKVMQIIHYLMAVGVSTAIALGNTLASSKPSAAQSKTSTQPATEATSKNTAKADRTTSNSTFERVAETSSNFASKAVTKAVSSTSQIPAKTDIANSAKPSRFTNSNQPTPNPNSPSSTRNSDHPSSGAALRSPRLAEQLNQIAQVNPTSTDSQPNSSTTLPTVIPATTPAVPAGNNNQSVRPVPRGYLNPDPNPLRFPTRPSEVQIQGTQPITLQEAIELAERNTPSLQVARLNLERSRAALREAQAAYYPNVSAQAELSHQDSNRDDISQQPQLGDTDTASTSLGGSVGVSYDIFTSGRRSATVRAAEQQVRSNELEVEVQREQLRLDVTNNYYDLQQSDEQVRISRAAVETAQASLRDALALERAGVGTRFDVLRFQVDLANSQQDLTQALSDQRTARRQLAQRLNIVQSIDLAAADPVEIAGLWNLSLEQSIVQAFKNRAELEQQLLQRDINEQQRRIALAENRPQLSAFLNTSLQDTFDDDRDALRSYSLGARVNWNLFDGGAARARARQEEIDTEIAENQFADVRNQVRLDVEQSFFNLQSNFENIQTASVALEQARESLRLARLRFQAGVGTQTDVISAQNELTRAEGNRLNAILNYNRALATLQRSITNLGIAPSPAPGRTPAATAP